MEIKIKQDNFFDDKEENCIFLKPGEKIIVRGNDEDDNIEYDYLIIKCGAGGKLLITTNLTQNMEEYNLVKASQKLLGYPTLRCVCGSEKGGLPHLHPIDVPFELESEAKLRKFKEMNSVKEENRETIYRYDSND